MGERSLSLSWACFKKASSSRLFFFFLRAEVNLGAWERWANEYSGDIQPGKVIVKLNSGWHEDPRLDRQFDKHVFNQCFASFLICCFVIWNPLRPFWRLGAGKIACHLFPQNLYSRFFHRVVLKQSSSPSYSSSPSPPPRLGTSEAEIKVPSVEKPAQSNVL